MKGVPAFSNQVGPPEPSAPPPPSGPSNNLAELQRVLNAYEVTIAEANDLVVLQDYDIVIVADDSGSMSSCSLPLSQRVIGQPMPSRWEELKGTVQLVIELATCFDKDGIDIYFLNRPPVLGVTAITDPRISSAFSSPPSGGTPLQQAIGHVIQSCSLEKPLLILVATDGVPNGGPAPFMDFIRGVLARSGGKIRFQFLACTEDPGSIGWLNALDHEFREVDVTDDYWSEKAEVDQSGRFHGRTFRRGDWIIKALLGPVSDKYDSYDEPYGPKAGGRGRGAAPPTQVVQRPAQAKSPDGGCGCVIQ